MIKFSHKKAVFIPLLLCGLSFFSFAKAINYTKPIEGAPAYPPQFSGLWESSDRINLFEQDSIKSILKTFYGWYYDGSDSFRNDTTVPGKLPVKISYTTYIYTNDSWAGELELIYPGNKSPFIIPAAIIGDSFYLDFAYISDDGAYLQRRGLDHKVGRSPYYQDEELISFYKEGDNVYYIRYWELDTDYEKDTLSYFSDNKNTYYVNKHIKTAGKVFTCCSGRETRIRNIVKTNTSDSDLKDAVYDSQKRIVGFGKPYLQRIPDTSSLNAKDELERIIKENNSRVHIIPPIKWPSNK